MWLYLLKHCQITDAIQHGIQQNWQQISSLHFLVPSCHRSSLGTQEPVPLCSLKQYKLQINMFVQKRGRGWLPATVGPGLPISSFCLGSGSSFQHCFLNCALSITAFTSSGSCRIRYSRSHSTYNLISTAIAPCSKAHNCNETNAGRSWKIRVSCPPWPHHKCSLSITDVILHHEFK